MSKIKTLIMGAAGRDFHNFNTFYRDNEQYKVAAFTATQIPDIEGRVYPPELAGRLYPNGIPIHDESELLNLIAKHNIEEVVFSYSDLSHVDVMHKGAIVNAAGADFKMMGMTRTAVKSTKPVIGICAIRTGCGKSQTTRRVAEILKEAGKKVAVIRHPMPYGDLAAQVAQRFEVLEDLEKHKCTIEEMEEYEPHINQGTIVYAGIDYEAIVRQAEKEADIILWDGGNNDMPFYKPDLLIVVADPHRPGHELEYYPGETNLLMADVVVINKIDTADPESIDEVRWNIRESNPDAIIIDGASPITVDDSSLISGKKALVIEDGALDAGIAEGREHSVEGGTGIVTIGGGVLVRFRGLRIGLLTAGHPAFAVLFPAFDTCLQAGFRIIGRNLAIPFVGEPLRFRDGGQHGS